MTQTDDPSTGRPKAAYQPLSIIISITVVICLGIFALRSTNKEAECVPKPANRPLRRPFAQPDPRIPRILHHIYLSGTEAFIHDTSTPDSALLPDWSRGCQLIHAHWEHRWWNESMIISLIEKKYPWMMKPYTNYTKDCTRTDPSCNAVVMKGDLARLLVLHAEGGLYLDVDVECWLPADEMLLGLDVVLQGSADYEGVTNAIMAGVAGHEIWLKALKLASKRLQDPTLTVFKQTGPMLLADVAKEVGAYNELQNAEQPWVGRHILENSSSIVEIYPLGRFYTPCFAFGDMQCYVDTVWHRAMGRLPQGAVGMHRYSGSWGKAGGNEYALNNEDRAKLATCEYLQCQSRN